MTVEEIIRVIAKALRVDPNHVTEQIDSPELWDSFSRIEVIVALEDQLGDSFSIEEISRISTVSDLLDALKGKA